MAGHPQESRRTLPPQQFEVLIPPREVDVVEVFPKTTQTESIILLDVLTNPQKYQTSIIHAAGRNIWIDPTSLGIQTEEAISPSIQFSGGFWRPLKRITGTMAQFNDTRILPPNRDDFGKLFPQMIGSQFAQNNQLVELKSAYQPTGWYTYDGMYRKIENTMRLTQSFPDNNFPIAIPEPLMTYKSEDGYGIVWNTQSPRARMDHRLKTFIAESKIELETTGSSPHTFTSWDICAYKDARLAGGILNVLHTQGFMHGQFTLGNIGAVNLDHGTVRCLYDMSTMRTLGSKLDAHLNRAIDVIKLLSGVTGLYEGHKNISHGKFWILAAISQYAGLSLEESIQEYADFVDAAQNHTGWRILAAQLTQRQSFLTAIS
ncbi:hypothetical protein KBD81_02185 [Candidatus Woesebacteria bacterium]|nr:hypothetical protein [Candidatus Woesebacteria bacterium]